MAQGNLRYWFKAKKYGYGWYPATWQGWVILLIYFVVFGILIWIFESDMKRYLVPYEISVFFLTALLIFISYKKGEPARWRWGK